MARSLPAPPPLHPHDTGAPPDAPRGPNGDGGRPPIAATRPTGAVRRRLVGEYPGRSAPLALLSGVMFFCSLSFTLKRLYLLAQPELTKGGVTDAERGAGLARSVVGPALYALAFASSFPWPTAAIVTQGAALAVFILAPPNFGQRPE